ncbi:hypothetical protein FACS1894200_07820 [Spirochaetia bacterium]|nr:hypothetical protein FACS1894200_07820 [Spirochaetia bacterium]
MTHKSGKKGACQGFGHRSIRRKPTPGRLFDHVMADGRPFIRFFPPSRQILFPTGYPITNHAFLPAGNAINSLWTITNKLGLISNKLGLISNKLGLITNKAGLISNKLGLITNKVGLISNKLGLITIIADIRLCGNNDL